MAKQKIPVNAILSARIRETRMWIKNGSKMTQAELAEKIGVEDQTIRKYESGKFGVPKTSVAAIAEVFGCCMEYLYGDTNCFTQEEYKQEQQEEKIAFSHAKLFLNENHRQWEISKNFIMKFLHYKIRHSCIKENDGSFIPVILIEDPQGKKYTFLSRIDTEDFLLSYFDDAAKLLRYRLLDYADAKTATKPTPTP